jgi:transposase
VKLFMGLYRKRISGGRRGVGASQRWFVWKKIRKRGAAGRETISYIDGMEPTPSINDVEKLKQDAREGRIDSDRLVDLIVTLQRQLQAAMKQLETANQRIEELEKNPGGPATAKVDQSYSLDAEEKRQEARGKKKPKKKNPKVKHGRISTKDKIKLAERTDPVFPEGVPHDQCKLSHTRVVWRLEYGRAVLIAYAIYRGPKNQYGKITGVMGRSEFGLEIVIEIAHLVHIVGLSFDKVCGLLNFFQKLKLKKSQVDALLYRLSQHWEHEFEVLCTLLANSAVVHADETSWSLNSVWAFLSEQARVLLYGVPKDGNTLKAILDVATFAGIVISDDAAVYANFSAAQKCWAHLLRKAIKLTLEDPDNLEYRQFTDRLLEIYREACRVQRDGRLSDAGRAAKVAALDDEIFALCGAMWLAELPPLEKGPANDYRLLANEVMRVMLAKQLFTFVTAKPVTQPNGEPKPVAGTNNEAERTLRNPASARDTGRTDKTRKGARRRTILVSVLESLRLYLPEFTLDRVVDEVKRWWQCGQSCFTTLLQQQQLQVSEKSVLDAVLPVPNSS